MFSIQVQGCYNFVSYMNRNYILYFYIIALCSPKYPGAVVLVSVACKFSDIVFICIHCINRYPTKSKLTSVSIFQGHLRTAEALGQKDSLCYSWLASSLNEWNKQHIYVFVYIFHAKYMLEYNIYMLFRCRPIHPKEQEEHRCIHKLMNIFPLYLM